MTQTTSERRPRQFDIRAKVVVTTVAMTALVGGWNLVAQLDDAKAEATAASTADAALKATAVELAAIPMDAVRRRMGADFEPLNLAPIPALPPASQLLVSDTLAAPTAGLETDMTSSQLPAIAALAPLPTMAPLAALSSLPAPTAGGSVGGSPAQTSGGS